MTSYRLVTLASLFALISCTAEEEPVDQQAQCNSNCIAAGHASGSFDDGLCSCITAPPADAGITPVTDTGSTPTADTGSQPAPTDAGTPEPQPEAGTPGSTDAGFSSHDIGVIDPDAGAMILTREMRCSEICQWGFNGWEFGSDGGPGQAIECPQDREVVFGAREPEA